jgi:hypothetical protein
MIQKTDFVQNTDMFVDPKHSLLQIQILSKIQILSSKIQISQILFKIQITCQAKKKIDKKPTETVAFCGIRKQSVNWLDEEDIYPVHLIAMSI